MLGDGRAGRPIGEEPARHGHHSGHNGSTKGQDAEPFPDALDAWMKNNVNILPAAALD